MQNEKINTDTVCEHEESYELTKLKNMMAFDIKGILDLYLPYEELLSDIEKEELNKLKLCAEVLE